MSTRVVNMIKDADLRALARTAVAQGWTLSYTGSSHLRWRSPAGKVVFSSSTPSDSRSVRNTRSQLRRVGLVI